jgi:hypothetical protein
MAKKKVLTERQKHKELIDDIAEYNEKASYPTGFESCIIGMVHRFGEEPAICLDEEKVIKLLMKRDKMTEEEAWEFYDYNILGYGSSSETLPVFLNKVVVVYRGK